MANYNVLTLSEPVADFVATTSPETINVQCSLTEDAQRKRVWAVCKAGGIPAHPYDGIRVEAKIVKPEIDDHTLLLLHMEDMADSAPIPKTVTSQGEVTFEVIAGGYGKSARFRNASYLKVELPDHHNFPGDFTVDFRIYPLAWGSTSTNYNGLVVGMEAGGLVISREPSGLLGIAQLSGEAILDCAAPPLNEWTHIAVCRSGTSLRIFYNGVLQAQTDSSLNFTASPIAIGGDHLGSYFNGYIDEFRISDTARWTSDFEPPTVAYGQQEPVKMTLADLVNGTEYGVRIFVEGKYGYQTALEGATAAATPRASMAVTELPVGALVNLPRGNVDTNHVILHFSSDRAYLMLHAPEPGHVFGNRNIYGARSVGLVGVTYYRSDACEAMISSWPAGYDAFVQSLLLLNHVFSWSYVEYPASGGGITTSSGSYESDDLAFLPSLNELGTQHSGEESGAEEGFTFDYFKSFSRAAGGEYWSRTNYVRKSSSSAIGYTFYIDGTGGVQYKAPNQQSGFRPVVSIPLTTLVYGAPNASGAYDLYK